MFQNYEQSAQKDAGPKRLAQLRENMKEAGVTHFIVPHADEHQNEYLPNSAERLAWLTGFTGSAGFAIAGLHECIVFVDGRYTLQVKDQVDLDAFTPESLIDCPPSKWIETKLGKSDIIGYDPWLTTIRERQSYEKAAAKSSARLKPVANLIDLVWKDRPAEPQGQVTLHAVELAGEPANDKIKRLQEAIKKLDCQLAVLTDPASLAWAFNIRGSDVVHNPLALGFAILRINTKPLLFMADSKLTPQVRTHLEEIAEIHSPSDLLAILSNILSKGESVLCDPDRIPIAITDAITETKAKVVKGRDPVSLPRAIKNAVEIEGARAAHLRDGVAMVQFLAWLDQQSASTLTEISAAMKLEEIRNQTASQMGSELREISFDTISAFGPNGAINHYRVTHDTCLQFEPGSLYLCDSGAQYPDGTTDITRTISIGEPPASAITDFTLVLKGHIALACARFPKGSRGVDLDVLARHALWQSGKDYAHGTGHGIGSYLNVHEGPQNISRRGMEPLVPGMIISNEPGYYVEGNYGIRIENLILVTELKALPGGNIEVHEFETLTLCPIDLRLVDASLLSDDERDWLNVYHTRVHDTLAPHLDSSDKTWLAHATRSI